MSASPMHIALVIERFDAFGGGAERSTAQIATELVKRGHRVTVLTGRCDDAQASAGVEVMAAPRPVGTSLDLVLFSRWVRRRLMEGDYDASLSMTMAAPAMVLQPRGGTVRETLQRNVAMRRRPVDRAFKRALIAVTPKYQAQLAVERRTLRDPMVRRVVAISDYVRRQLRTHYQIDDARIELIPNAAQSPRVGPDQRRAWRGAVRSAFEVPAGATAFVFAAHNPALKGFEPLLHATRLLEKRGVDVLLLVAGSFWYPHHRQACEVGVRDRVRFVRQTRRMDALFAAADATVLPTFYDPCSKVVIESLMMGVPAISSGYNGASDFIAPPDGPPRGLVVAEPWDVQGLADAMAAMADPQQRQEFMTAAAGLGEQLGMARHVEHLERVLRAAAAESSAGSPSDAARPTMPAPSGEGRLH